MDVPFQNLRQSIRAFQSVTLQVAPEARRAAVALILRPGVAEAEILMIRRAERENDPWSGQIGFPGGRMEPRDASIDHVAIRETREELGISLEEGAEKLGWLSEIQARSRMRLLPLFIRPVVFELTCAVEFRFNHEVVEAFWIPLSFFIERSNRGLFQHESDELRTDFPCYRFGGNPIWGLSLAMLDELLFEVLRR